MATLARTDYLHWDEYFMVLAIATAKRSKDPSSQVGCVIVHSDNRIASLGYNGFPRNVGDDSFTWERTGEWVDTKYPYVVHAEMNAILNAHGVNLNGAKAYVTLAPCNECAKTIIQVGIKEVIYLEDKHHDDPIFVAARRLFDAAGVNFRQYQPAGKNREIAI